MGLQVSQCPPQDNKSLSKCAEIIGLVPPTELDEFLWKVKLALGMPPPSSLPLQLAPPLASLSDTCDEPFER